MSLTVVFRQTALRGLARLRGQDTDLFTRTRQAISQLPDQPAPTTPPVGRYRHLVGGSPGVAHQIRSFYSTMPGAAALPVPDSA